ncbi:MAG: hypothetical protein L0323_06090 [Planctomycetes bacterium]|nr:hypothetical protein [Planctomycetota bacterium]
MRPELAKPFGRIEVEIRGHVQFEVEGWTLAGTVTRTGPDGTLDLEGITLEVSDPSNPRRGKAEIRAARGRARLAAGSEGAALAPDAPLHLEAAEGTYVDPAFQEAPVRFRAAVADLDPRARTLQSSGPAGVERGGLSLEGEDLAADLAKSLFSLGRNIRFAQATAAGRELVATAAGPARAEVGPPNAAGWRRALFVLENAVRVSSESPRERSTGAGDRLTAVAEIPPRGSGHGEEVGKIRELSISGNATLGGAFGQASSPRLDAWLDGEGRVERLLAAEGSTLLPAAEPPEAGGGEGRALRIRAIESRGALQVERAAEGEGRFDAHFAGPTLLHEEESVLPSFIAGPSIARIERAKLLRLLATGGAWLRFGGANAYAPVAEIVPEAGGLSLSLGPSAFLDARAAGSALEGVGGGTLSSGGWASFRLPQGPEAAGSATLPDGATLAFEGGGFLVAERRIALAWGPEKRGARVLAEGGYRLHDPKRGVSGSGERLEMDGEEVFKTSGTPARLEIRAGQAPISLSARTVDGTRSSLVAEGDVEVGLPAEWIARSATGRPEGKAPAPEAAPAAARCARLSAVLDPATGEVRTASLEGGVSIESPTLRASGARFDLDRAEGRHRLDGGDADARLLVRAPEGEFEAAAPEIVLEGPGGETVLLAPRGTVRFRPSSAPTETRPAELPLAPVDLAFEGNLRFETGTRVLRAEGKVHAESAGETPWTLDAKEFESRVEGGVGSLLARGDARFVARDLVDARGDELRFDPRSGDVVAVGNPAVIDAKRGTSARALRLKYNLRTHLFSSQAGALSERPNR